ncbi:hypothetical protein J3458_001346 [Metarhizium acridum]|uniref:uncharacterized protein n=1 Tax=Metarhizium acridum TaxID=92637 RepID=UPI001C6B44D5|nr:hypothetical protein J3458_001346 [Metarhizium acridum]
MASSNDSNSQQENFKTQLDRAAVDQRERDQDPKPNPIVEKIAEFIPAAGKVLEPKEKPREERREIPGPPETSPRPQD